MISKTSFVFLNISENPSFQEDVIVEYKGNDMDHGVKFRKSVRGNTSNDLESDYEDSKQR